MIIGCLGDSNTRFGTPANGFAQAGPGEVAKWPEYAPSQPGGAAHTWKNFGVGGAGVCVWGPGFEPFIQGQQQAKHAIEHGGCNLLIASFGTNDYRVAGLGRDAIVAGYCALIASVRPIPVIVALTPDATDTPGATALFQALNARLRALGRGGWRLVDFWTDSTDHLVDGVHFDDAFEIVRAQRAIAAVAAYGFA